MFRLPLIVSAFFAVHSSLCAGEDGSILAVFQKHCVKCHGREGKVKGKVNLLEIESPTMLAHQPELLGEIIAVIDFEEMPPEDQPQLGEEDRATLLAELEALRERSLSGRKAFAHTPLRRMNRFQYDNAVVDLFASPLGVVRLGSRR